MTKPSAKVRAATFARDKNTCVAANHDCGGGLEWGHRESSGHGGRGSKAPVLTVADGISNCRNHNQRFEGDLQDLALRMGWKVKRNRCMLAADIPYYSTPDRAWYLPLDLLREAPLVPMLALELLDAAGSLRGSNTDSSRLGVANSDAPEVWNSEASATPTPVRALGVTR